MLGSEVVAIARQRLGAVDAEVATDLDDAKLLAALRTAVQYYTVQQVAAFSGLTVDVDAFDLDDALQPEPDMTIGMILAFTVAADLGQQAYAGRLRRGELGTSWRSGIEEESSVTAAANYKQMVAGLNTQVRELLLVYHREAQGARIY